ncbi:glycoside hydrolase family 95-like protein [Nocardiopsis sediminis]|uniref:Glycoside hydrolase family 95-like protein n=1 Tax=Nocardiopsis sediminis TaxID=1778267 RepID=A0ABV8FUS5_9ACTN
MVTRHPVTDWEDALITGNGRHGALVHGGAGGARVTLSHERLFLPTLEPLPAPATAAILPELRDLLSRGEGRAAARRITALAAEEHPGYAQTRWIDPLIAAAVLSFVPDQPNGGTLLRRCDHASGLVTEEYGDGTVLRAVASRADDTVAVELSRAAGGLTDRAPAGGLNGLLRLSLIDGEPPVAFEVESRVGPDLLALRVGFPGRPAGSIPGYAVTCEVTTEDGAVAGGPDGIEVRGAARLLAVARVRVGGPGEQAPPAITRLSLGHARILASPFDRLFLHHRAVHAELFGRFRLRLGRAGQQAAAAPQPPPTTDGLTSSPCSPEQVERLVDAGRYAVIGSCGDLPPTLQGVWSGTYDPPWRSGYTLDGNLASAVAALHPTGVPELMTGLFDLLDGMHADFADNARRLYGCRGILLPAHLSTHGRHNHFTEEWSLTCWTAGAAWLARLHFDHYAYTGDTAFLRRRALPFLTAAGEFYEDFVTADGFRPSYSPENTPGDGDAQACVNATMDIAAVRDLARNLIRTHHTLRLPGARRWARLAARLPGYRIGADGELAEWATPAGPRRQTDHHGHRHASHLYPLWYEPDPAFADPALRAAAVRAVRARLAWWRGQGSDEMAFGLVQLGLAAARLGLADDAHTTLALMAERYWRPTMVSTHNRGALFNTDICGGFPAVVTAMLAGSAQGRLDLLPALPAAWPEGEVTGLRARGGLTIDRLTWADGRMSADVTAAAPRRNLITTPDGARHTADLRPGEPARVEADLPVPRG